MLIGNLVVDGRNVSISEATKFISCDDFGRIRQNLTGAGSFCYVRTLDNGSYGAVVLSKDTYDTLFFDNNIGNIVYYGYKMPDTAYKHMLHETINRARDIDYKYLYYRIPQEKSYLRKISEELGFDLCVTNVDFRLDIRNWNSGPTEGRSEYVVRVASARDIEAVREIAFDAFRKSRIYKMGLASQERADTYHSQWAENIVTDRRDTMLVAEKDSGVIGFLSFRTDSDIRSSRFLLGAVKASERRKGVWHMLVKACLRKASEIADEMNARTQENNIPSINCWRGYGFQEIGYEYGYHKTF